jgi:uncharacterized membrane-anchored protein
MSETLRRNLVIAVVALQMVFFAGWYGYEVWKRSAPVAQIMVKTAPVDPRDLLSGQYISLSYNFSRFSRWDTATKQTIPLEWAEDVSEESQYKKRNVWVVLTEEDGFYEPKFAMHEEPTSLDGGDVAIKGRTNGWRGIEYGIEKYFVAEGTKEPKREDTTVKLNIYKDGSVTIAQVFVKGKPWP